MKIVFINILTEKIVKEADQPVSAPIPFPDDLVRIDDTDWLVVRRAYLSAPADNKTGLRYPQVNIFVQNLK